MKRGPMNWNVGLTERLAQQKEALLGSYPVKEPVHLKVLSDFLRGNHGSITSDKADAVRWLDDGVVEQPEENEWGKFEGLSA